MTTAGVSPGVLTPSRVGAGIVGGLVGGVAFGVLMQAMDMIPMVAMLVGSEAIAVGWLVHLAIAAFIGATFAMLFGRYATSVRTSTLIGAGYGVVWWVLGALILMPARLGRVRGQHRCVAEPDGHRDLRAAARCRVHRGGISAATPVVPGR